MTRLALGAKERNGGALIAEVRAVASSPRRAESAAMPTPVPAFEKSWRRVIWRDCSCRGSIDVLYREMPMKASPMQPRRQKQIALRLHAHFEQALHLAHHFPRIPGRPDVALFGGVDDLSFVLGLGFGEEGVQQADCIIEEVVVGISDGDVNLAAELEADLRPLL